MSSVDEYVVKRDGRRELVDLNKITERLKMLKLRVESKLKRPLNVNVSRIVRGVVGQMFSGVTTSALDLFAAEISAFITDHSDYQKFAGAIVASNLESNTRLDFAGYAQKAYNNIDHETKERCPLISDELVSIIEKHRDLIQSRIKPDCNLMFDYLGMKTMTKGKYLLYVQKEEEIESFETPQHMWMRVSLGINGSDLDGAFELYDILSEKLAIMATPTLFSAGTPSPHMSSCFLLDTIADSIRGILDTNTRIGLISKDAGGVGLAIHKLRSQGARIVGTNGNSNGIVPFLRIFDATALAVDQGGGKRKGAFSVWLSPEHPDIFEWLDLKKNLGAEELRARNLFYGLWISDEFMRRVVKEFARLSHEPVVMWSLMDPNRAKGLDEVYGEEFDKLYCRYESEHMYKRQVPIRELWHKILSTIIETGIPYIMFKDACNRKSNQQNLGTIKCSNLCNEIVEFSSPEQVAVCNLASIALPEFYNGTKFDFDKLYHVSRVMIRNLDKVIDRNHYTLPEAEFSNKQHRPVGLGIQGLATLFLRMKIAFTSPEARKLNLQIAETMYFAAITESHALAVKQGAYPSMLLNGGAPISKGIFQQDMWPQAKPPDADLKWDWEDLRTKVKVDGVRNSLLIAHMPTQTTSHILGNSEYFEPWHGFIFSNKTKNGEFFQLNPELVQCLSELGLWKTVVDPVTLKESNLMRDELVRNQGSIANIAGIPDAIKAIFKTVWEIKLVDLTDMMLDRAQYICQASSFNVHVLSSDNMMKNMTKFYCYIWKQGSKNGSYYTRTKQKQVAITDHSEKHKQVAKKEESDCTSCGA